MSKILLVGATGLVGSQVFKGLCSAHDLHIISRRPLVSLPPNVMCHVIASEGWAELTAKIAPDIAISCLGTTIKTAGSKTAFAAVDFDLVTAFAAAAKESGARQMIAISSVGASASSANFYLSTKGKAEAGLRALEFGRLDILRPGLLRGDRQESRAGEALGMMLSPFTDALMHGPLRRYRSIDSATVARAIVNLVETERHGQFIHENDAITALAG